MLVRPDDLILAAQRLTTLQSDIADANATAARSMTNIAAAAQDEVSQGVASLFSVYGQQTQAAVTQHGVIGTRQFAQGIASAASSYSAAEASNNAILTQLELFFASLAPVVTFAEQNPLQFLFLLAGFLLISPFLLGILVGIVPAAIVLSIIIVLFSPR